MLALKIIGIIVLFFAFILSLKATITIAYSDEVALTVKVLFIKIKILPSKDKAAGPQSMSVKKARKIKEKLAAKKKKKQAAKVEKAKAKEEKKKAKKKKSLGEILEMISLIKDLAFKVIKKFFKHLRIDIARIKIHVAMGDAANTAVAYGAITAAVSLLFPVLEKVKNFSLPDADEIDIRADFLSDSIEADVMLSFSIRVWHIFDIAFGALGVFLKHQFNKMKKKNA